MTDLAAVIPYNTVTADQGVLLHGQGLEEVGRRVQIIGDVNGDGIDDLIISASTSGGSVGGNPPRGAAYVVFGKQGGFNTADFDVTTVNGSNGFKIVGAAGDSLSKFGVSGGDFNGDGYADLLISANTNNYAGHYSGGAYVIFGRETFGSTVQAESLTGSDGFLLSGILANSMFGGAAASAGDLDGDGKDDIAVTINNWGGGQAVYIHFGAATEFVTDHSQQANATQGVFVLPAATGDQIGTSIAAAGDVNGDGRDDFLISARAHNSSQGAVYVLFGRDGATNPFTSPINLADLSTNGDGIRVTGLANSGFGSRVAAAGDVNGDGLDDIMVSDWYNHVYVLFGGANFDANFTVSGLTPDKGFILTGEGSFGYTSLSRAGDLNGDGYDEIIVGAYLRTDTATFTGAAYLVYGRASFGAGLNVVDGSATGVVSIRGVASYDWMGQGVAGGGDLNGDGRPDIVASSMFLDYGANQTAGGALVIYGPDPNGPISFTGSGANDSKNGAAGADILSGMGGNDVLYGLGGDDTLDGGDLSDTLYGGDGADDLIGGAGGDILYGDAGADELSGGDGADKLFGGSGTDLLTGGLGNDRLDGETEVDTLRGGAGNDTLDGGIGADFMYGGADNDVYIIDNTGDKTIELADEGYDIVRTTVDWTLADNIEALEMQGTASLAGEGNSGANNLQGNSGANWLRGLGGVDTINGGDGNDYIDGGAGNDLLRGGAGEDIFNVAYVLGSVLETDQVYDFDPLHDVIWLMGTDADVTQAGDQAFSLVSKFTKVAGQMTLTFDGAITTLRLDVNGDARADYQMKINGDVTGASGEWML